MGWQHDDVTEEWIKEECARHLDDPIIEELIPLEKKTSAEIKALCNSVFIQKALIVALKSQLKARDSQLEEKENQILQITGSMTWQVAKTLRRIVEIILPSKIRSLLLSKVLKRNVTV
jgi:hypothetical protein